MLPRLMPASCTDINEEDAKGIFYTLHTLMDFFQNLEVNIRGKPMKVCC